MNNCVLCGCTLYKRSCPTGSYLSCPVCRWSTFVRRYKPGSRGKCIHHWQLGSPAPVIQGICKKCGAHREWPTPVYQFDDAGL